MTVNLFLHIGAHHDRDINVVFEILNTTSCSGSSVIHGRVVHVIKWIGGSGRPLTRWNDRIDSS